MSKSSISTLSIPAFGTCAFLSSSHKWPNDRLCDRGEKGSHASWDGDQQNVWLLPRKGNKRSLFLQKKKCSFVLIWGRLSLCRGTLAPVAILPLNYSIETTCLSLFPLSVANGPSIPLCPTVILINSIKLLKVIFGHSGTAVSHSQRWLAIFIVKTGETLSKPS